MKKIFAITFMLAALWGISAAYAGTNTGSTAKAEPSIAMTVQPAITHSSLFTGYTQAPAEVRQTDIVVDTTATPPTIEAKGMFCARTMANGGHISYVLNPTQPGAPPLVVNTA